MSTKKITYNDLYEALKNNHLDKFKEHLYIYLTQIATYKKSSVKIYSEFNKLIHNIYDDIAEDAVHEVYCYFMEKKLNNFLTLKDEFPEIQYFVSYLHRTLNTVIYEFNSDDKYQLRLRLSKEIKNLAKNSDYFEIKEDILHILKRIDNPKLIKKNNVLGVSNKNLLDLIMIVSTKDSIGITNLVDKCLDYLINNGYIESFSSVSYNESDDEDEKGNYIPRTQTASRDNSQDSIIDKEIEKAAIDIADCFKDIDAKVFIDSFINNKSKSEIAKELEMTSANITYISNRIISIIQKSYLKHSLENDLDIMDKLIAYLHYFLKNRKLSI